MSIAPVFVYHQSSGELFHLEALIGRGYSGQPPHTNVTADEAMHNLGPIPRGDYLIDAAANDSTMGPLTIRLVPFFDTAMFGRDGLYVHGERKAGPPGFASHGCPIFGRDVREILAANIGGIFRVV